MHRSPYLRTFAACLAVVAAACSGTTGKSATELVEEADAKLRGRVAPNPAGGLEFNTVRADMKSLYDEALRKLDDEDLSAEQEAYIRSHAHFGLAMTRLWDLAERLQDILEQGGVVDALRGVGGAAAGEAPEVTDDADDDGFERPSFCRLFDDFDALESIIRLLLRTALEPVIEDLAAARAAAGDDFEVVIERARYDLGAFTTEQGLDNYFDLAATYGPADIAFLLGATQIAAGGLNYLFAYNDLFANLFLFSFVVDQPVQNQIAKVLNSNPCVDYPTAGNPMLDPRFATLTAESEEQLKKAQGQLSDGFTNLARALRNPATELPEEHLIGAEGSGDRWGVGLTTLPLGDDRFSLELPSSLETPLVGVVDLARQGERFINQVSPLVPIERVAAVFLDLGERFRGGGLWDMRSAVARLTPGEGLVELATLLGSNQADTIPPLSQVEMVQLDLRRLFREPVGDLKTVFPRIYREDEPFQDVTGDGRRTLESLPYEGEESFISAEDTFQDRNCNGRWDQRGDLVVQHEYEPFVDENANTEFEDSEFSPIPARDPGELGVVGTFLDVDADGNPDRPAVDGTLRSPVAANSIVCGASWPVTWPGATGDPLLGDYSLFTVSDPRAEAPYGVPETSGSASQPFLEPGGPVGALLGHYWAPDVFAPGAWPGEARRDPANGTVDSDYLFVQDPTFGGVLFRERNGRADAAGTSNAWFNRFLSQWGQIQDALDF